MKWLNSISGSIKFTVKYSEIQLEVLRFIINGRIESKVYFKPIDGHMYLLPQSSHHPSLYRNISFGVALRDDWFEEQLEEYHQFFKRQKYNNRVFIRPGTLHALMLYCLNRESIIPNET